MKKLDLVQMEEVQGSLLCSTKEGYVYASLGMALVLSPTVCGSILMSLTAIAVSQMSCHN